MWISMPTAKALSQLVTGMVLRNSVHLQFLPCNDSEVTHHPATTSTSTPKPISTPFGALRPPYRKRKGVESAVSIDRYFNILTLSTGREHSQVHPADSWVWITVVFKFRQARQVSWYRPMITRPRIDYMRPLVARLCPLVGPYPWILSSRTDNP
jgi:hypothetical protein